MDLDPTRPHLVRLDSLAVLEIRGDDRTRWLQGQITQDVHAAKGGKTIHGFHLDAQGKILAELRLVEHEDAYLGIVEAWVADGLVRDLDRRIVMEDVELKLRPDLTVLGIHGGDARAVAAELGLAPVVVSDRFGLAGVEVPVSVDAWDAIFARVSEAVAKSGGDTVAAQALDDARVLAGVPRFLVDFGGTLPQETGIHRRTVSFVKGCYVGQEPVVMIEHRGKPPRRTCVVRIEGSITPPCDLLRADGTVAGKCTSAAQSGDAMVGIALLKRADAEGDQTFGANGSAVRVVRIVELEPA